VVRTCAGASRRAGRGEHRVRPCHRMSGMRPTACPCGPTSTAAKRRAGTRNLPDGERLARCLGQSLQNPARARGVYDAPRHVGGLNRSAAVSASCRTAVLPRCPRVSGSIDENRKSVNLPVWASCSQAVSRGSGRTRGPLQSFARRGRRLVPLAKGHRGCRGVVRSVRRLLCGIRATGRLRDAPTDEDATDGVTGSGDLRFKEGGFR